MPSDLFNESVSENPELTALTEEWRSIAYSEGYQISNLGRVRSCRPMGNGRVWGVWRIIKPWKMKNGYLVVALRNRSKRGCIKKLVHRLVLEAFVGPCPEGMEARHVDNNNRSDNRLSNLCWGTRAENQADRKKHGTHHQGEALPWTKLTEEKVVEIKRRLAKGERLCTLARLFEVKPGTILKIRKGQIWGHVSL